MSSIKDYLRKTNFKPRLSADPVDHLKFIVVIPCHDEPDLEATLQSLELAARPYHGAVEIIVVINDAIHQQPEVIIRNKQTVEYLETRKMKCQSTSFMKRVFFPKKQEWDTPEKLAWMKEFTVLT